MLRSKKRAGIIRLRNDIKDTFATEAGQRVLLWLLHDCHMYENSSADNAYNPYETMFRDGKRRVVLNILHFMQESWTPEQLLAGLEKGKSVLDQYFPPDEDSSHG